MNGCTPQTLSGIATECGTNVGGIKVVAAQNRASLKGITVTDGKITAIDMATGAAEAAVYGFRKQTGSLTSTYQISDDSGSKMVQSDLVLRFAKMETSKRVSITALANAETVLLVKDQNDKVWLLGYDNGVTIGAGVGQTGTAFTDANEYQLTLTDLSRELPYEVADTAVTAFLAGAEF